MKELVFLCLVLHLSLIHANPKSLNQVAEFSTKEQIVEQQRYGLTQDGNTLVEIDLLKDYYPYAGNHIIRKRNVVEPLGNPEAGTPTKRRKRKRKRRRRKKVSGRSGRPSHPDQFKSSNADRERPAVQAIFKGTIDGPVENILDPSSGRRRSSRGRRPRPQLEIPIEGLPEQPKMSEMIGEDTDGLLRAKELQANYINTDMMRANKLKADRIRADKIKAQDVVVTAKRTRRKKRPSTREYIQPEPVYERTGTQRFNSVVDSPMYDPQTVAIPGRQNFYDAIPNSPQNDHSQINNEFVQQRHSNRDRLFPQQETFTKRRYEEPNVVSHTSPVEHPPAIRPRELLPEFSSSQIVNKYAGKQPIMSEFIAEPPSFRSNIRRLGREKIRGRTLEKYNPSTDFFGFDNPDAYFDTGTESSRLHDETSKTYITKSDPWYFR